LSKTDLQSRSTFQLGFLCHQSQQIGFQDASGAFAARQFSLQQSAIFRQAVNQPQRTTKSACHFARSDEPLFHNSGGLESLSASATDRRQEAGTFSCSNRRVGLESRPDYQSSSFAILLAINLPQ
jgi:hypothetical protein